MPLKGIPTVLSPDLLFYLAKAGHGDEIVLADAHFPTSSVCREGPREIRVDGIGIPRLLKGVLKLLPLDAYVDCPVAVMQPVPSDVGRINITIWEEYDRILRDATGSKVEMEQVERFAFYERAKKAFAVVHTGETACYGNIILKKGVVQPESE